MNTRLRAFVVGLVAVMSVGTLGAAVATGATVRPRTVMLEKLNEVRSAHGLHVVRPALLLRLTAQRHSDDMVIRDYFSHTSPGGSRSSTASRGAASSPATRGRPARPSRGAPASSASPAT
jgi:hypothetical protein